jgi:Rieske Fe-S protein
MPDGTTPNVSCESCLARRAFVSRVSLAAIAALLAPSACGDFEIGGAPPTAPSLSGDLTLNLADLPELGTVGGIARVTGPGGVPLAVTRTSDAAFLALSLVCPHAGTTLNVTSDGFLCPNHGARFAADGHWVGGQPTSNMYVFPVLFDAVAATLTITTRLPGNVDLVIRVADFPALQAVGGVARVDDGSGPPVGVGRAGESEYVAYGLACPHQQYNVEPFVGGWRCPAHDSRFTARGELARGPAVSGLVALFASYDQRAGTIAISGNAPLGHDLRDDV